MRYKALSLATILSLPAVSQSADLNLLCAEVPKYQVETITAAGQSYTVRMNGRIDGEMTRDPVGYWAYDQYWEPNVFVKLENVGDVPVVNPWIRRGDRLATRR